MEKENTIGTVKNRGKELFLDIFYDIAGSLLMSIGIFCFIETADIAPGGVSGVAIMLTLLGFNLLGDGLRDALDPRLKR